MALCAPPLACGLFGLGGLFTAAELAVADQLVQLSGSGGGDEPSSSSSTSSSSPRSVNTCTATAAAPWQEKEEEEEELEVFAGPAAGGGMVELDRRARKRYRLLSELYAATAPPPAKRGATCRKRKRNDEPEPEIAMWYGEH